MGRELSPDRSRFSRFNAIVAVFTSGKASIFEIARARALPSNYPGTVLLHTVRAGDLKFSH